MNLRTARRVAGSAAAGSIAMIGGAMALAYVDRHSLRAGLTGWDFSDVFADVVILAVPAVGFLLASRRPANRIGWLFLAAGLAVGLSHFSKEYGLRALIAAPGSLPAGRVFGWLSNWTCSPLCSCSSQLGNFAHGGGAWPPGSWPEPSP